MKKFVAFFLALTSLLSLSACLADPPKNDHAETGTLADSKAYPTAETSAESKTEPAIETSEPTVEEGAYYKIERLDASLTRYSQFHCC